MKRTNLLTSLTVAGALFALGGQAHATSWGDYSQSTSSVSVGATNPSDTTVLNTVTVVCPAFDGWLVATADAEFISHALHALPTDGLIGYSITRDNVAPIASDNNHNKLLSDEYMVQSYHYTSAGMQRVDSCTPGQSVTYKFVAWNWSSSNASLSAVYPRMTVQFISNTI